MPIIIPSNSPWYKYIAENQTHKQDTSFITVIVSNFSDGESAVKLNLFDFGIASDVMRIPFNKPCCILSSLYPNPNDRLIELGMIIDSLRRCGAGHIAVVAPYFCYTRQDRVTENASCLSSGLVLDFLYNAGVSELFTFDIHSESVLGYSKCPFYNVPTNKFFLQHIKELPIFKFAKEKIVFVAPDVGSIKRCRQMSKSVGCPMAIVDKKRHIRTGKVSAEYLIGDVDGMHCIIIDDIIGSGSTLLANVSFLKKMSAKSITAYITHPVLSGNAVSRIDESDIDKVYVTNSIELRKNSEKVVALDLWPQIEDILNSEF
ncbi:Ribose-phosphate pyrophosphokinase [Candidatus Xenohaliotis californiensis]|uniref:ribose-phosphate diphosphokinase n=1 Tax=Candidatus Xenohaliotis californiensis TaxID=84677 RepID=A0ABM9N920_9RICK|nr:Ribose-phosphate pyrophosphokinase [Candidatus Xenohaliotis californiensis]